MADISVDGRAVGRRLGLTARREGGWRAALAGAGEGARRWLARAGRWALTANLRQVRCYGLLLDVGSPLIRPMDKLLLLRQQYETPELQCVRSYLPRDLPLVELGGGLGVLSCVANRLLERPEQHLAVEAHPGLIEIIGANRRLNGARFELIHAAVAYGAAEAGFRAARSPLAGRVGLAVAGADPVATVSLGRLMDGAGFARASVLCDIEGAEFELVEREHELLAGRVPCFIVETHPRDDPVGQERVALFDDRLHQAGLRLLDAVGDVRVYVGPAYRRVGAPARLEASPASSRSRTARVRSPGVQARRRVE